MNGVIAINKRENMTSFDVVRQIQRKLGVKAGHSGTLDPNATGVLVVAINRATKALRFLEIEDKVYTATVKLGVKTDTGDIWGNVLEMDHNIPNLDYEQVSDVLKQFVGKQTQRVPMVSAKKVDGKKLYEYYRENIEIKTRYTEIEIFKIELNYCRGDEINFTAHVSSGTYMRTICEDIAVALNTVGTMSTLNRDAVGSFTVKQALELDEVNSDIELISVKDIIPLPKISDPTLEFKIKNGHRISLDTKYDRILLDSGEFFAVYDREKENTFKSVRGLW